MAVIVFSQPVPFPIAPLRELLAKHLPLYSWMCGENDTGDAKQMGTLTGHDVITGRSPSTTIFTELRAELGHYREPAPAHEWYLEVGAPTTELKPVADRIILLTCMCLMIPDSKRAFCQLRPGGNWLDPEDLLRAFKLVLSGEDIAIADGLGQPAASFATASGTSAIAGTPAAAAAASGFEDDKLERMLAPMLLMLERSLVPDWRQIENFAQELDPDGAWKHIEANGANMLAGRGTRVIVIEKPDPAPPIVYEKAYSRSFWYKGDRTAVARHRRHLTVGSPLDTSAADWETVRQVAKVATLVVGLLARLPGTVAVQNLPVATIFDPEMAGSFLSILGRDQLPVQLWCFSAWHSLEEGNVSVSTSGLVPFLGHEIEAWNAPLTAEEAQQKISDLIIYLLDKGPVIGHGDTCGQTMGEKSIRCFLGPSRAERGVPVQALLLEFETEAVGSPKPDLPTADDASEEPLLLDQVLDEFSGKVSPAMAKILGDIRKGTGAEPEQPPRADPSSPAPVHPQHGHPLRRATGFGRKGL